MQIVFGAAPTRTVFNVESASSKASCVFMVHIGYVIMDVCALLHLCRLAVVACMNIYRSYMKVLL